MILTAELAFLIVLAGKLPVAPGPNALAPHPEVPLRTSYTYVQFLGQRWHLVVAYQGSEAIFDYNPDWTVRTIRERAIRAFRLTKCEPSLSLFSLSGTELSDTASTDAAGINPGDHLVLGPSKANSGTIIGCSESLPLAHAAR
jgi:hypothetical protein